MGLEFKLDKVKDWQLLREPMPQGFRWKSEVDIMVFTLLAVGIPKVVCGGRTDTARLIRERAMMLEKIGSSIGHHADGAPVRISREFIKRFDGLTTNVGPYTRQQFRNRLVELVWDRASRELRAEDDRLSDAAAAKQEEANG